MDWIDIDKITPRLLTKIQLPELTINDSKQLADKYIIEYQDTWIDYSNRTANAVIAYHYAWYAEQNQIPCMNPLDLINIIIDRIVTKITIQRNEILKPCIYKTNEHIGSYTCHNKCENCLCFDVEKDEHGRRESYNFICIKMI